MKKVVLIVLFLMPSMCCAMEEEYMGGEDVSFCEESWENGYDWGKQHGETAARGWWCDGFRQGNQEGLTEGIREGESDGLRRALAWSNEQMKLQNLRCGLRIKTLKQLQKNLNGNKWKNSKVKNNILSDIIVTVEILESNAQRRKKVSTQERIPEARKFIEQQEQMELLEWKNYFIKENGLNKIKKFVKYTEKGIFRRLECQSLLAALQLHCGLLHHHLGMPEEKEPSYIKAALQNSSLDNAYRKRWFATEEGE